MLPDVCIEDQAKNNIDMTHADEVTSKEAYPPEAVQVRNTFIHVASPNAPEDSNRPAVVSCPASHIGCMLESLFEEDIPKSPLKRKELNKTLTERVAV